MNQSGSNRSIRLLFGLVLAAVPVVAFLLSSMASPLQTVVYAAPAARPPAEDGQTPVPPVAQQLAMVPSQQDEAPTITSDPPDTATVNVEYRYLVEADGSMPITFTLGSNPPQGMAIQRITDQTALVTWTPRTAGTFSAVVVAQNQFGSDVQSFTIDVIAPTATPTRTRTPVATPIYVDQYEPNDSLQAAYTTSAGLVLPLNTLWPAGDIDYFRFHAKKGSTYTVFTEDLDPVLDTYLTVYSVNGNPIGTNDDVEPLSRASEVTFRAGESGFYFASVVDRNPLDSADATYSFGVTEVLGTPTATPVTSIDDCEPNGTFQTACLIQLGTTYNFDFVPVPPGGEDNDFFRFPIKQGLYYVCETSNLSPLNDTNMILYTGPGQEFGVAGNDDKSPGDLGSRVGYLATYTGWLYVLVGPGPNRTPEYESSNLYTYSLECLQLESTPTPTASITPTPSNTPAPKGGGNLGPSPTPFSFTPQPSPTPFAVPTFPPTPTATPPPVVNIVPLPTNTPAGPPQQDVTLEVTVYYDANLNFMPEMTEGIMDVAVALYDDSTGQLLSIGYTNEDGTIRFGPVTVSGPVRVSVPFLNFTYTVSDPDSTILLRVAPSPLPQIIP